MNSSKLHPKLVEALQTTAEGDAIGISAKIKYPIIVQVRPTNAIGAMVTNNLPSMQIERTLPIISAVAGNATRDEIDALAQSNDVEKVWLDEPVFALLDQSIPLIGTPVVWNGGNEGEGIKVCVIDTGVDPTHPDLQGRVLAQRDFTGEGVADGNGHGTHVAAIVAGDGTTSGGMFKGVAPRARILGAKSLNNNGSGSLASVIAGIEWGVFEGANILNLSLGTSTPSDGTDALSVACNNAVAAGVVVCVAAGNSGPNTGTIGSPGAAEAVITVGASTDNDTIANFSSRGPTTDGRNKPDVVAPGHRIIAALSNLAPNFGDPVPGQPLHAEASGTSMATPHVSGISALVLVANSALTPAEVKVILRESALDLGLDANTQGTGRVQADVAVNLAMPAPVPA